MKPLYYYWSILLLVVVSLLQSACWSLDYVELDECVAVETVTCGQYLAFDELGKDGPDVPMQHTALYFNGARGEEILIIGNSSRPGLTGGPIAKKILAVYNITNPNVIPIETPYELALTGAEASAKVGARTAYILGGGDPFRPTAAVWRCDANNNYQPELLPPLQVKRLEASAMAIDDQRILMIGGADGQLDKVNTDLLQAEIYDTQSQTATWVQGADGMPFQFPTFIAKPLITPLSTDCSNGCDLLITGGFKSTRVLDGDANESETGDAVHWAYLFRYADQTITEIPEGMNHPRVDHAAVYLPSRNQVLITGGKPEIEQGGAVGTYEIYEVANNQFQAIPVTYQLRTPRSAHSMVLAHSSDDICAVHVIGGEDREGRFLSSTERVDFNYGACDGLAFRMATSDLQTPRHLHSSTVLADQRILIIGGQMEQNSGGEVDDVELYVP